MPASPPVPPFPPLKDDAGPFSSAEIPARLLDGLRLTLITALGDAPHFQLSRVQLLATAANLLQETEQDCPGLCGKSAVVGTLNTELLKVLEPRACGPYGPPYGVFDIYAKTRKGQSIPGFQNFIKNLRAMGFSDPEINELLESRGDGMGGRTNTTVVMLTPQGLMDRKQHNITLAGNKLNWPHYFKR